jgi:hypothetical protein
VFGDGDLLDLNDIIGNDMFASAFDLHSSFPGKKVRIKSPFARIKDILLLFQLRLELGEFLLSVTPDDTLDSLGILLELHSEGFGNELDIKLLVDVGLGQAFLDNELLLRLV